MSAAIIGGADLAAGAVTCVRETRNPVTLARVVMRSSRHLFVAGESAEALGREHGLAMQDPEAFVS